MPSMVTKTHNQDLGVFKSNQTVTPTQFAQTQDDTTLDAALTAGGYTAATLKGMNTNDKLFAWRQINSLQA